LTVIKNRVLFVLARTEELMTLKKVLVLLFAALFILPLSAADDFDDEFGGFDDFEDEGKKKESKTAMTKIMMPKILLRKRKKRIRKQVMPQ
jgi:hypothetical protein